MENTKTSSFIIDIRHLVPPPLIKRQMHSCGGKCLSHQQKKRDTIMRDVLQIFSKDINQNA